jgi:hypothetical protein
MLNFDLAGGSVAGKDHMKERRSSQDSYHVITTDDYVIALVCDGCGSCSSSEVGAKIGVRMLGQAIKNQLLRKMTQSNPTMFDASAPQFLERVRLDVTANLRVIANMMGESVGEITKNYFLFSVVGTIICPFGAIFFSLGDGFVVINEEMIQIGPFPGNKPPYLGYELMESTIRDETPGLLKFNILRAMPMEQVESFLIATDGLIYLAAAEDTKLPGQEALVGPVSQFWTESRYFTNPDNIRRRLCLVNGGLPIVDQDNGNIIFRRGLLADDTTIVVGRRRVTGEEIVA